MRCRIIRSDLLCCRPLVPIPVAATRLPSRSSRCFTHFDCPPRLIVSGSGELGVGVIVALRGLPRAGVGVACFVGDGQ